MSDIHDGDAGLCRRAVTRIVASAITAEGGRPLAMVLRACDHHARSLEAWLLKDSRAAVSVPVGAHTLSGAEPELARA